MTAGIYRLRFGTDMDGDGSICDAGELGGTFPAGPCDQTSMGVKNGGEGETFEVIEGQDETIDIILNRINN